MTPREKDFILPLLDYFLWEQNFAQLILVEKSWLKQQGKLYSRISYNFLVGFHQPSQANKTIFYLNSNKEIFM